MDKVGIRSSHSSDGRGTRAAGFGVGIVVGLTGMGGGALMTPMLVLFFGVPPLAAVSSDLVVSAVMKPFGGVVHARRGTVNWRLVGWLCVGSVPSAFCGVLLARAVGGDERPGGRPDRARRRRCSWPWPACVGKAYIGPARRPVPATPRSGSARCRRCCSARSVGSWSA